MIPSGTQFVGYSEDVNLYERKSEVINAESVIMTTTQMLDAMNLKGWDKISITTDGAINTDVECHFTSTPFLNEYSTIFNYTYINGSNKISFVNSSNLYISNPNGGISATSISFNNFINGGEIYINTDYLSFSNLEKLYFPNLKNTVYGSGIYSSSIKEIHAPLYEGPLKFNTEIIFNCNNLQVLELPLYNNGGIGISGGVLTNIHLPSLVNCFTFILQLVPIVEINETNLFITNINYTFFINICSSLQSINLGNLKKITSTYFSLYINECNSLVSFSMPNIEEINQDYILSGSGCAFLDCTLLRNVNFGTIGILKKAVGPSISISNCPVSQESIDGIFALFVSLDGTNGTELANVGSINVAGTLVSPPSAQGIANAAILQSRGWAISYNL